MPDRQNSVSDVDVDLRQLFASLLGNWRRILGVALLVTGLALVGAMVATPHYRGETRILIETRESVFTRPDGGSEIERPILDEEGVTSQVEVIASTDILRQVIADLDLSTREEFSGGEMSAIGRALVLVGLRRDPSDLRREERVLRTFREKLEVYRVENSRVIVVQFSSEDPELAAAVPNAIAEAYIAVQREAKQQSNLDATDWLEPEIAELSERVKQAEARVASFRSQSDLLIGQNNTVLATQQLSELSTELSRVRASRGAAEAKAESLRAAIRDGTSLETLPDVLSSGLIQRLRERQVQLRADIADLSTTLLGNHPRIRALNSQLADLDGQIRNEAAKVLQGLETEVSTARFRERQLVADLNTLKAESARAGDEQVELRALEREAAAQRELLESYLSRFREAASRGEGNYLPADARVFSRAIVPSEPYFPKILPITAAAFFGSLLVMGIVTLLQELFSGRAMRHAPGSAVHAVPQVAMPVTAAAEGESERTEPAPLLGLPAEPGIPEALREMSVTRAAEKLIGGGATRAIFVSPEGDEAAAAAVLVAREVADAGLRVLLLDMTASGAASRPMLDGAVRPGITNLLASEAQFTDVIHGDLYSDAHVIPVGTANPARAMRAAERLPIIMSSLTTAYDVVIAECGPADAEGIRRLVADATEVLVSIIDPEDAAVVEARKSLAAAGYDGLITVSPVGYEPPSPHAPRRSAA